MRIAGIALLLTLHAVAGVPRTVTVDTACTAGIDGRAWDTPFPDARTVDAVHRSVLLRFPGTSEAVARAMADGATLVRADIALAFEATELSPDGYTCRTGLGKEKWEKDPPRWHIVARALRRPWVNDGDIGPTCNAYINGAGYWQKWGAQGPADGAPEAFAPVELSAANPAALIDVSETLLGPDLPRRLRLFEDCGVLLRKQETYDVRYRDTWDAYEWAVPTGGHGLTFQAPRLVLTFADGPATQLTLEPAADVAALAREPAAAGSGSTPTAVMPGPDQIRQLADRYRLRQPTWMPDWQYKRVSELAALGGGDISRWREWLETGDPEGYRRLVAEILAMPPRYWRGWGIQDDLLLEACYGDMLPEPVREHLRNYWTAWLMPDIPTAELFHPQSQEAADWYAKTGDWRGRTSFFRAGYCYAVSTMNFNHTAAMGALLGGAMTGSEFAMEDGRHCLDERLLRFWNYLDGTSQETVDHYYLGITLSGQKMFADFGPTRRDRLAGQMIRDRQMELLISAYHPGLKRVAGSSHRTNLPFLFVKQDGIYHALHTLSPNGVLLYADGPADARVRGMPVYGDDFPAGRCAVQSLQAPWAEPWAAAAVDCKELPFEIIATETTRGNYDPPLWQRVYLGRRYALASQDIKGGTVDVMAQWHPGPGPVTRMEDRGTLTMRYSVNRPNMSKTQGGTMPYAGGMATFQHRNRAIVCTKPRTEREAITQLAGQDGVTSLSTTIALWNFRDGKDWGWDLHAGNWRIDAFPARVKAGTVITLRDGDSYVGIIPLPATDLGRDEEVVLMPGFPNEAEGGSDPIRPALLIESYNLRRDKPLAEDDDWERITTAAYGGYVLELGDATEYADFAAFRKHMLEATLETRWDAGEKTLHVTYRTGTDVMEMGFCTAYAQGLNTAHFVVQPGEHVKALPYRRINGEWPYLPPGIDRDTPLAQQGSTGRLEKNGAVLITEPGRKAYLRTDPEKRTWVGYNPLPDPTPWELLLSGQRRIRAVGKLGLARVIADPDAGRIVVDCEPGTAEALEITGFGDEPHVEVNGTRCTTRRDGETVVAPLP